ncbi:hypothetical protein JNUCC0626_25995 [Lentzea sp. JNUCC 0626]|uniref:hypothetical protein n=1 Tax=Lentzea sp. JNUCC 0626 TaxID=3367513 RepID=UPI00374861CE
MSELTTMSITVTVAPHAAGSLSALTSKQVAVRPAKRPRHSDGNSVHNQIVGTVLQIGNVHGNVNINDNR